MIFKLTIHLLKISVEILYGKFPNTINFSLNNFVSSTDNISLLIIFNLLVFFLNHF